MDIQMPVIDGMMALKIIREKKIPTPVVALTANAMKDDQEKYSAAGFDEFIAKPIDSLRLRQVLEKFLRAQTSEQQTMISPLLPDVAEKDPSYLKIIESFIERLPEIKQQLADAMAKKEWKTAQEIVHKLKGMGTAMGFPTVSEIAAGMMFQFKSENFSEAARLYSDLDHTIDRILAGKKKAV
jgi:HPt (histidine-containing phosphotransfer) domain-containing protein